MAWIEFHVDLRDHWKVHRLKDTLKIRYAEALGLVACLWTWAAQQAKNGDLKRFTEAEISAACRWQGDEKNIIGALKSAEFLNEENMIHDWKKHGIKWLESSRKRQKQYRKTLRNGNVTVTSQLRPSNQPNQPNLTKPDHTTTPTPSFQKPTGEEATAYAASIGLVLDGHYFVDYYETRGWMIKGAKIKNWKACVRTWKTNTKNGIDNKASLIALTETVKAMP